jgi:hypothetical protein
MTLSSTSTTSREMAQDEHLPWRALGVRPSREHSSGRAGASFCKDATRRDCVAWHARLTEKPWRAHDSYAHSASVAAASVCRPMSRETE